MAIRFYQYPSIFVTSAPEAATAANGASALPSVVKIIAGWDGTNVRVFKVNAAGELVTEKTYLDCVSTVRNVYSSTPVTTGAWVQLVASTSIAVKEIEIFDSSGQTMELGLGGAGSEVRKLLVIPGGNGKVFCVIPAGSRVSIRAVSGSASVGEIDVNFYG